MVSDPSPNKSQAVSDASSKSVWLSVLFSSPVLASAITGIVTIAAQNAEAIAVAVQRGISLSESRIAIEQSRMWQENFECSKTQPVQIFKTQSDAILNVTVCPSGDMLVQVLDAQEKSALKWVSFESFNSDGPNALSPHPIISFLMSPAIASSTLLLPISSDSVSTDSSILAQSAEVICQEDLGDGRIRRVIKYADGSCVTEVVDTFTGEVTRTTSQCQSC